MKTSLEMRSKNLRTTLENVLKQVASDVVVGNPITENDQGSHRITVRRSNKVVCDISVLEKTYEVYTPFASWANVTTYSGEESEKGYLYYVDSLEECVAEVERLVSYVMNEATQQPIISVTEEWPKHTNEQVDYVTAISSQLLRGTQYCAIKSDKRTQHCAQIFPVGHTEKVRDRVAEIWPKSHAKVDFSVKKDVYERIDSRVRELGDIKMKPSNDEIVYDKVSFEIAKKILRIIADVDNT